MEARLQNVGLTEIVGVRVTEAEQKVLQGKAEAAGLTLSEWSRKALLASVSVSPECRLLLSELLAFRKLAGWLQVQAIRGLKPSEQAIGAARKEADSDTLGAADRRIAAYFAQAEKTDRTADPTGVEA